MLSKFKLFVNIGLNLELRINETSVIKLDWCRIFCSSYIFNRCKTI